MAILSVLLWAFACQQLCRASALVRENRGILLSGCVEAVVPVWMVVVVVWLGVFFSLHFFSPTKQHFVLVFFPANVLFRVGTGNYFGIVSSVLP